MEDEKVKIELDSYEAEQFVCFRKNYIQIQRLLEHDRHKYCIFDAEFTGQVVLDILNGQIKNKKREDSCHYGN